MLTTITSVRKRLGLADSKDDDWIESAIKFATGMFERVCNRNFARVQAGIQEFDACDQSILLRRYPVEQVVQFQLRSGNTWSVVASVEWDFDGPSGCVHLYAPLGAEGRRARVIYTGGYVLPGDVSDEANGLIPLPDEIQSSCIEQVAYWYQRRDQLALSGVSAGGGSVSQPAGLSLLPVVVDVLQRHARIRMT